MFDLIVDGILVVLFVVFLIAEIQQWGVPERYKNQPLTYFED